MASDYDLSHDALLDRADRAIAASIALRARVETGLKIAERKCPIRRWADDLSLPPVLWPAPLPMLGFLDLWCSVARVFAEAGEITWKGDAELERAWHRIRPTIVMRMNRLADPA